MELTLQDVARLLNVPEQQVETWISEAKIPSYRLEERVLFNRDEIIEWATACHLKVALESLEPEPNSRKPQPILMRALRRGGIHFDLPGESREEVLREVTQRLPLPSDADKDLLFHILKTRELTHTSAIGEGIAVPHVKNPIILHVSEPVVAIFFLKKPIEFNAPDRQEVYCLFTIVSGSVQDHLLLLSHVANVLREPFYQDLLRKRASPEELFQAAEKAETAMKV